MQELGLLFGNGAVFLPDLDVINLHGRVVGGWVVPGFEPCILAVPEGIWCVWVGVGPWLLAVTFEPVIIGTSDGNVENEEVFLVEWCILVCFVHPWVAQFWIETSLGEHVFVMLEVQDFLSIDGGNDFFFRPLKSVDVEVVGEIGWMGVFSMTLIPSIKWISWSPMQGRAK